MDPLALIGGACLLIGVGVWCRYAHPRITFQTTFGCIWGVLFLVQGTLRPLRTNLEPVVLAAVLLAAIAGFMGGWLAIAWRRSRHEAHATWTALDIDAAHARRLTTVHLCLVVALGIYIVLQMIIVWPSMEQAGGLVAVFTPGSGAAWRFKSLVDQRGADGGFFGGSALVSILSYLTFLGNASLFTGAILLRLGRRFVPWLPLALNAVFTLLTFQRTSASLASLLFLCAWVLSFGAIPRRRSGRDTRSTERAIERPQPHNRSIRLALQSLAIAVAGAVVILVPLQLRNMNSRNSTGLLSVTQYLFSSIGGMNARVVDHGWAFSPPVSSPANLPGWGAYTFTGLVGIMAKIGLPLHEPPHAYDYYTIIIAGQEFSSNTASLLYDLFLDGGFVFIFAFFLVLSLTSQLIQVSPRAAVRVSLLPLSAFLVSVAAWSYFTGGLTRDVRYLGTCIFACLVIGTVLQLIPRRISGMVKLALDRIPIISKSPSGTGSE